MACRRSVVTGLGNACAAQSTHLRLSALAGVDENGSPVPPPPGTNIDHSPLPYWKNRPHMVAEEGPQGKPAEIPDDIWERAKDVVFSSNPALLEEIARALHAERERCAGVANVVERHSVALVARNACREVANRIRGVR